MPLSAQQLLSLTTSVGLDVPPPPCLPINSTSGFDMMSILARVATRSHPKIILGPVDLTCSFVVVNVRRHDRPIVYAFPSFYQLTGYEDHEAIGRNCRFLQSPTGMSTRAKKGGTSLPRPFSIYTKRWSRIRNVKRASPITGEAVRRLSISSLSSLSLGALTIHLRRRTKLFITSVFRSI